MRSSTWRMAGGRLVRALAGTGTVRTAGYSSTQNGIGHTCNVRRMTQRLGAGAASGIYPHAGRWVRTCRRRCHSRGTAQRSAPPGSFRMEVCMPLTSAFLLWYQVRHQHQVSVSDDGRRLTHTRTPLCSRSHSVRLPMDSAVQRLLASLMVGAQIRVPIIGIGCR